MNIYRTSILALFCVISIHGNANAEAESDSIDSFLNLTLDQLRNVEITSPTRTPKNLQNVPAAVTVFTQDELRTMGVDFLYEVLSYVPGFQTGRDNDAGASYLFSSRGSDTGQQTSAILLLVDGVPRHEVRTSSASTFSSMMPISRIKRIEILRGPGSALYGSNAFLGVINIVTNQDASQFSVRMGQFRSQQLQGQYSTNSGDWHFDTFVSAYKDDGESYMLADRLDEGLKHTSDPQAVDNFAVRLGYKNTQISAEHINLHSEDFYSYSVINNDINKLQTYLDQVALKQLLDLGPVKSTLQASYHTEKREYSLQITAPGALASLSTPSSAEADLGDVLYDADEVLLQWLNDWQLQKETSLQFGVEWQRDELNTAIIRANFNAEQLGNRQYPVESSQFRDIETEVIDTKPRKTTGIYAQLQHQFASNTDVLLGVRSDSYSGFDDRLSPRLAVVQKLDDSNSLKFFVADAYRAPSFLQQFVKPNIVVVPNPDLKPETIRTTELIWSFQKSVVSSSIGAFYNEIDDRIDSTGFAADGRRTNANNDREYSSGLELEASIQLHEDWLLRSTYTYFDTLPDASFRDSKKLASVILTYHREKFDASLAGYYKSERKMPSDVLQDHVDESYMFSTKVGYQISKQLNVDFQIKNLFDEDVASAPQSKEIDTPVPYRGREASMGLTFSL